jgi:sarcosine oxidase, subunit beta
MHEAEVPRTAELVVIGGGVVGAATAFQVARNEIQPVIVEARGALCTLTTPKATGGFRLQFDNREELALVRESVELFLTFPEATGQREHDLGIRQQGYLWLTTEPDRVERQRSWGLIDVEVLSPDDVRHRFPYVGPNVLQGRFRAADGFLDTTQLTLGLAKASGAPVVLEARVIGFRTEHGRLIGVETSRGPIATERVVVACGPLSGRVAAMAGIELPIETVLRHKLTIPDVPEAAGDAPMTIDEETGTHWRPAAKGAWLLCTDPRTPPGPPTEEPRPDPGFTATVLHPSSPLGAARIVPFWREVWKRGGHDWHVEAGQYTMTPDHRPLIGPTTVEGLYVNTGYSGHGIMGSPAGSRILADLLTGRIAARDNPFRLDRAFERRDPDTL